MDGNKDPVYVPSTLSPMQRSGVSDSYLMVSCTCKSRGTGGAYWLIGLIKADAVASKNLKLSSAKSFIIFLYGNRLDIKNIWVRVHQPFSRTFFVVSPRIVNLNVTQILIG